MPSEFCLVDSNILIRRVQPEDSNFSVVAAMHVYGVQRILTFNIKDFTRFNDIEAIHPIQIVQDR